LTVSQAPVGSDEENNARLVLVSQLINRAGRRLQEGEFPGALADLTSATTAFREGGASSVPYLAEVIEALHHSAMAFTQMGLWAEAIDIRRLMVELFAEDTPPAVIHLLALTLHQAAQQLSRAGRTGGALACADEAVELARALCAADAGGFRLFLAQALGSQAGRRQESGDSKSGLDAALEAVDLFHDIVQTDAAAAVPALILTLESLSAILGSLGLADQAATVDAQRAQLQETLEQMIE
jgi:tetratricopeptide (TPR) repeat protein